MKYILAITLILVAPSLFANWQSGQITGLVAYESSGKKIMLFKLDTSVTDGCNTTARFAFDDSKVNYDLMSSSILSAYHAKTPVKVRYEGTCNAWGNSYDARFICLGDINC